MLKNRICVASAIVRDDTGRILLIRRAKPPEEGRWTLPGGRVEAGETSEEAAAREVLEETGLSIQVVKRLDVFRIPVGNGDHYEVHNFLANYLRGDPVAGDDACDVGWFTFDALLDLNLTTRLLEYLRFLRIT